MKEGWEYKTLGECCDILDRQRKPIKQSNRESGSIPYYGATGLLDYVKDYIFDDTLVLLGEDGAKWGAGEDSAFVISGKSWVNNHAHVLKPHSFLVDSFLVYFLKLSNLSSYITGVTVPKLNQERMKQISIPIPSLEEQRRIVSYLDSSFKLIDEIKEKAQKSLSEAKALFQSALAEAMEPKEGWEEKTLGEICFIARGGSPRPIKNFLTEDESGIPWIKIGDTEIGGKYINRTKEKIKKEGIKSSRFVSKGDFLLSNSMSFGRPYILKTDGCIHDGWLVLQNFKDTFIDDFLYYLLSCRYVQNQFDEYAYGSTVRNLKTDSVSRVLVDYPPLSTQKQIVSHLDKLSSNVKQMEEKYQKIVEECDALKQAMLRDVFE